MDLIRDLLDKQVLDARKQRMGKVDGLCCALHEDGPPEVTALVIGAVTLADRVHPRLARWVAALSHAGPGTVEPLRIPCERIRDVGLDVEVDVEGRRTRAFAWERWLRDRVVARIPLSGAKGSGGHEHAETKKTPDKKERHA